jgi:UDP:flavonoid glycosyltransferase YjiC (YdhE family)
MKILVAPLNWGLGHASRCVPVVRRLQDEGHEVILGGDGESLTLLRKHFPKLRYVYLAPLNLRYSKGRNQVGALLRAMPHIWMWMHKDHALLKAVLREEIDYAGPSVVIARRECIQTLKRHLKAAKKS